MPRSGEGCDASCSQGEDCCFELGWEVCVDTGSDELNCGGCGIMCGWGETCSEGECVPWLSVYDPCLFGRVNCGAPYDLECANLGTDEHNCGSCGVKCAHGSTCVDGVCTSPTMEEGVTDVR